MAVIELGIVIPDTPEELLALIGDPAAEPQQPFSLLLLTRGRWGGHVPLRRAPIGIYRVPAAVGERVESAWPAIFHGPLTLSPRELWELRTHDDRKLCDGKIAERLELARQDTLACTLALTRRAG